MTNDFLKYDWKYSKNDNLYKVIDGVCYTIIEKFGKFSVLSSEHKKNNLKSLFEAKEFIFEVAYQNKKENSYSKQNNNYQSSEDYYSNSSLFENETLKSPLFKELIKLGYRQLSKKYHPDMQGGNSETMKQVNVLFDDLKKVIGGI
jgi:hypothetical protein